MNSLINISSFKRVVGLLLLPLYTKTGLVRGIHPLSEKVIWRKTCVEWQRAYLNSSAKSVWHVAEHHKHVACSHVCVCQCVYQGNAGSGLRSWQRPVWQTWSSGPGDSPAWTLSDDRTARPCTNINMRGQRVPSCRWPSKGWLWVSPPSPAGRCCKRLPDQQPAEWGPFQNAGLAPAHLRSAAAPNAPGAGVAHTGRLHLYTHAWAGQWEGADRAEWFQRYSGVSALFLQHRSAKAHLWAHRFCDRLSTSDRLSSPTHWWESFQQPVQHRCVRKLP